MAGLLLVYNNRIPSNRNEAVMQSKRLRDYGLSIGTLTPGKLNAITDVAGVKVGHTTLISGEGKLIPGEGPIRTGVTVVLPHDGNLYREKVRAACHTINGTGKICGLEEVRELGQIEAPIALTGTLNVGLVSDALIQYMVKQAPEIGITTGSINVVVGEVNDSPLNDLQGRHVKAEHVFEALANVTDGYPGEGVIGGGTGTACFGWKGGMGTSSRVLTQEQGGYTVGALVQTNYGGAEHFIACGVPVGRTLLPPPLEAVRKNHGSVMIVLATDAPLDARQLHRLCVRASVGLSRTGSIYGATSGDFIIAFSTAYRKQHKSPSLVAEVPLVVDEKAFMGPMFHAVADCVEESVLNAMFMAETVTGRDDHTLYALPRDEVVAMIRKARD